ncbi:MAG: glycosyltransferase family 39 protein [Acidobacteria bacterium]|nr:glycosyltransferase family 39 protein [Acidobacteriota bacterium]
MIGRWYDSRAHVLRPRAHASAHQRRTIFCLMAAAAVLYLPGIWWGLPLATAWNRIHPWGTDELAPLGFGELYGVILHRGRRFDPRYPLFHFFFQGLFAAPYLAYLWISGQLTQASIYYPYGLADPVTPLRVLTILGRVPSLLMAGGVVIISYKTAARLWSHRAGMAAAMAILLTRVMFYYSRTSNVDMPAVFWTALGFLVFAGCARDGLTKQRAAWLGLFAALSTATKDQGYAAFGVLVPPLLVWHWRDRARVGTVWRAPFIGLAVSVLTYPVASGLVFHPGRYWQHVEFIRFGSVSSRLRHNYFNAPATLAGYLDVTRTTLAHVSDSLGPLVLALAIGGLIVAWRRTPRAMALALVPVALLLGVVFPVRFVLYRYVFLMDYVLALFAGLAVASALEAQSAFRRRAVIALFVLACAWNLARGADLTYQMLRDSRYEAAEWFRRNARPGDRVTHTDEPFHLPRLERDIETVRMPLPPQPTPFIERTRPEFITVIPFQEGEVEHEWLLDPGTYRRLVDGSLGYQLMLAIRTPGLFTETTLPVNPRVKVFVRKDITARMRDRQPIIQVAQ